MSEAPTDRERALIQRLRERFGALETAGTRLGIGDDAAVVAGGPEIVVSCDSFVEDVHFRRGFGSWSDVGYKAAVTSVSDLAAMAIPVEWVLVALGLDAARGEIERVVDELASGIAEAAAEYGFSVVGGDVSASGATFLSMTAGGRAVETPIRRSGARDGDLAVVTGALGCGAAALAWLSHSGGDTSRDRSAGASEDPKMAPVLARFLRPRAAFQEAAALRTLGARALIDISDGLASEAGHLAEASGVGVLLEASRIPVHVAARELLAAAGGDLVTRVLGSGEEYELLAAVPEAQRHELERACEARGWTIVGRFTSGHEGVRLARGGGTAEPLPDAAHGWRHLGD